MKYEKISTYLADKSDLQSSFNEKQYSSPNSIDKFLF